MDRVIEKYCVAVIYSPGFGAGWYTWNQSRFADLDGANALLFDPILVDLVKQKQQCKFDSDDAEIITNKIVARAEELCPDGYFGGAEDLVVEWVPIGTEFQIDEYDGNESIRLKEDFHWIKA